MLVCGCCVMLVCTGIHPAQTESVAPCLPGVGVLVCWCVVVLVGGCVGVLWCWCVVVLVCWCMVLCDASVHRVSTHPLS